MAQKACQAVRKGDLKILPAMHESTWFSWLENIRYCNNHNHYLQYQEYS